MVHYWEAVASGAPLEAVSAEEEAAAEAYATAAVAAAEAAVAAQELAAAERQAAAAAAAEVEAEDWAETEAEQAAEAAGGAEEHSPGAASPVPLSPAAATPGGMTGRLPAGEAATPTSLPFAAAVAVGAGTPARFTPLNFAAAPPPTPADGIDPQQAQQLHNLASGMAAAAVAAGAGGSPAGTPASACRTSSRLPATPASTPVGGTVALAVTPLALSALRARMNGSGGGMQDAVRSRLARLKADLQAAQAKLATVDQVGGLCADCSGVQRQKGQA